MANPNFLDSLTRKQIVDDIKSPENVRRKAESLRSYEVYNDNAYPYVFDKLKCQLSEKTAVSMPIVANLNIAKAVVDKSATIYIDEPTRTYTDISEADKEVLEMLYDECGFNTYFSKANKYYKLRNQSFLQVVPKNQKLKLRVLHAHNIDVIPDENDPEIAFAYIVSSFDKAAYLKAGQDGTNQKIADADDYKSTLERFQVWTNELVFTMNGRGDVIGDILPNPIGQIPFVDISKDKDFEFFVRIGQALTDFTIDFNVAWSDLMYIARMQGYSVGVLTGDANLKPDDLTIAPNKFLFLPKNPNNPDSILSLDFKSPTPNLADQLKSIEAMIATFLTTRGLDTKAISVNGQNNSYSSALERLLAMIDQFRATKDDFDLFKTVEYKVHEIVVKYLALLTGTEYLEPEYNVTQAIVNSDINVNFARPEMVETKTEMLANAKSEIDLGIEDKYSINAKINGISIDESIEELNELEQRKIDNLARLSGASGGDAQKTALNGAQVSSLVEIVSKVAAGLLPRDAAKSMIVRSFNVSDVEAEDIIGNAGQGFTIDPSTIQNKGF